MGMNNERVIITDTSGLVSLFSSNDRNHTAAVKAALLLQTANRDILIPAVIFVEFLNVLGCQVNHTSALAAVAELTPPYIVLDDSTHLPKNPALKNLRVLSRLVLPVALIWPLRMTSVQRIFLVLTSNSRMLAIIGLNHQRHKCEKMDAKVHTAHFSFCFYQVIIPLPT